MRQVIQLWNRSEIEICTKGESYVHHVNLEDHQSLIMLTTKKMVKQVVQDQSILKNTKI